MTKHGISSRDDLGLDHWTGAKPNQTCRPKQFEAATPKRALRFAQRHTHNFAAAAVDGRRRHPTMARTYLPAILNRLRGAEAPGARPLFCAIRKRYGTAAAFRRRCETGQEIIERQVREELEVMAGLAARNERCHMCSGRPAQPLTTPSTPTHGTQSIRPIDSIKMLHHASCLRRIQLFKIPQYLAMYSRPRTYCVFLVK